MSINLDKAYLLSVNINKCLEGLEISVEDRKFIPSLFHSTVIEHHRSIILLVERNLYSSACTLLRPLFEAYVKGLWFTHCAKDKDFSALRKDKFNKTFGIMVDEIDSVKGSSLKKPKGNYWKTLNSFTHSGSALLARKYKSDAITNSHNEKLIKSLLDFSENYALLSGIEVSMLSGNVTAVEASIELAKNKHGL